MFILASASPRRRELLSYVLLDFVVRTSETDEVIHPHWRPEEAVLRLSEQKARAVAAESPPGDLVLAADTMVFLDGVLLGKPRDAEDARAMLKRLSGRTHEVYTGLTLRYGMGAPVLAEGVPHQPIPMALNAPDVSGIPATLESAASAELHPGAATAPVTSVSRDFIGAYEVTKVTFRTLSAEEIDAYVETGEPLDKAGAYGIQARGALLVASICGDYYNVMGLPLCLFGRMLRAMGVQGF